MVRTKVARIAFVCALCRWAWALERMHNFQLMLVIVQSDSTGRWSRRLPAICSSRQLALSHGATSESGTGRLRRSQVRRDPHPECWRAGHHAGHWRAETEASRSVWICRCSSVAVILYSGWRQTANQWWWWWLTSTMTSATSWGTLLQRQIWMCADCRTPAWCI